MTHSHVSTRRPRASKTSPLRYLALTTAALAAFAGAVRTRAADGDVRWSYTTLSSALAGAIVSSPAVGPDNAVYIGTEIGASTAVLPAGRLVALRSDGTLKWQYNASDWIDSSPAVSTDGKQVVFGCWDGKVYSLNTADGSVAWTYPTGSYVTCSPAIGTDGTIYIGSADGFLYALTPTGSPVSGVSVKWRRLLGDKIESSPAIGPDGTIYVGCTDNSLYAFSPDGTQKWSYATGGDIVCSPAVAADGTVYVASLDAKLYALTPAGALKWDFTTGNAIDASPSLAADGTVCVGSTDGRFYAVNPDGTQKWQYPAASAAALLPLYSTAAIRSDGSILFGTSNASVVCLNSDGTLRWSTAIGDWADSSPVVARDGSIYVGCYDKKIYALSGAVPALLADWPQYRRDPEHWAWTPFGAMAGGTGKLMALSVRASPGVGDGAMNCGFIVEGAGSRSVLVRAVGPTLSAFNLSDLMPDPFLTVFSGTSVLATNDDWGTQPNATAIASAAAAVGDFALPTGSKDSALLASLSGGGYTAYPLGDGRQSGLVLVELYDTGGDATAYFKGLSTRNQVGTGSQVLVGGIILTGGPRTLLIRGVGPRLAAFGLTAANLLQDPTITLYAQDGTSLAQNDNWGTSSNPAQIAAAATATGEFSLETGSKDAAMVVTLPEGAYTVQLNGVNDTTGAGMIEVYLVP